MTHVARSFVLSVSLWASMAWPAQAQTWVFGGPGSLEGRFQDANGDVDSQGWLGVDCSPNDLYWQVDTFNAGNLNGHGPGNHALWAGQTAAQQPGWLGAPGYGNNWCAAAEWRAVVPNPTVAVMVGLDFYYNHDTPDLGYDFFLVEWHDGSNWQNLLVLDGSNENAGSFDPPGEHFQQQWLVQPSQLTGPGQDEVRIRLFVRSDGAISDEDLIYGADSDGAAQVDDILVTFDGVPVDGGGDADGVATFESGDDEGWTPLPSPCQCAILSSLPAEYDPSGGNPTPILGRILDASFRFAGVCLFRSPDLDWTAPQPLDGAFLEFDSFFWSTGRLGFTDYDVVMTWRVAGQWQPAETVFVGEIPLASWQKIHVDLTGVAPDDADRFILEFRTGFGDGLQDVIAFDNVTLARFDTAVAAPAAPFSTALLGIHPNPANPRATVEYRLEHDVRIRMTVYDLRGRKIRTLVDAVMSAGVHEASFDGRDDEGRTVASGIYLVRLETPSELFARRMTLVK